MDAPADSVKGGASAQNGGGAHLEEGAFEPLVSAERRGVYCDSERHIFARVCGLARPSGRPDSS